jgi:hypothetical protein
MSETSRQPKPRLSDELVDYIFRYLASIFGSRLADLWSGTNQADVREMWAVKLGGFSVRAIKRALNGADQLAKPPDLPMFKSMVSQEEARMIANTPRIEGPRPSPEQQRERAAELAAKPIGAGPDDKLEWAKRPRSAIAMHTICIGATHDSRLAAILAELREQGVCDDHGRLLRRWDSQQGAFVSVRS